MKHSAFAAASLVLIALVLAVPALAVQGNTRPCLCNPAITPMNGTTRTVYVATVMYEDADGDVPARVEVYIDGTAYPMRLAGKNAARGMYRARLTLPPGEHNYYFYAEDGRGGSERYPRYGAVPGPFVGQKKPMNRIAALTDGGVYFNQGSDKSIYTFTVKFRDRDDCKPPRAVRVLIDGLPHTMSLHSGRPNNGTYLYETMLEPGPHAYYFGAMDGDGDCIMFPAHGFLRGPDVTAEPNHRPVLTDLKADPTIGTTVTSFTYRADYRDADGDAPSLALVYIDGVARKMTRTAGSGRGFGQYIFRTRLPPGVMHDYYYYFEDGRGGTCRLPEIGVFHGPVVTR
jgi:hypothetical protein